MRAAPGAARVLTLLGGGAFGKHTAWIRAAHVHAMDSVPGYRLDLCRVGFGHASGVPGRMARDRPDLAARIG